MQQPNCPSNSTFRIFRMFLKIYFEWKSIPRCLCVTARFTVLLLKSKGGWDEGEMKLGEKLTSWAFLQRSELWFYLNHYLGWLLEDKFLTTQNNKMSSEKQGFDAKFWDRSLKAASKVWDNFWQLKALYKWWKMIFIPPKSVPPFHSQDAYIFVLTFWSSRKAAWLER